MIVSGKAFTIREAKFEGAVVQLIRDWATAHPDELVALDQMTKGMRREGQFMGKNMAHLAEIPASLYRMMQARFGRSWLDDKDKANIFLRNFRVGLLNFNTKL